MVDQRLSPRWPSGRGDNGHETDVHVGVLVLARVLPALVAMSCTVQLTPPPVVMTAPPPAYGAIHVIAATYGANCGRPHGNVTSHVQHSCDGQLDCVYHVDWHVIGDPAYGCAKDYRVEWSCGDDPNIRRAGAAPEAGFGSVVTLSCR